LAVAATLRLVRSQPGRADIEVRLREAGQLSADAAFSAARAGLPGDAAVVLNQGRGMLLSIVLERERADLARLRDDGYRRSGTTRNDSRTGGHSLRGNGRLRAARWGFCPSSPGPSPKIIG
jgi:hypothetical protein